MATEGTRRKTAGEQYQLIQAQLRAIGGTLGALTSRPGLAPELVDRQTELQGRVATLSARVNETWEELQPNGGVANAKQQVINQTNRVTQLRQQEKSLRDQLAAFQGQAAQSPYAQQLQQISAQVEVAERDRKQSDETVERLEAALQKPNDEFDHCIAELDALLREANALFAEASGRESASAAWQRVQPSRVELTEGRDYHRELGKWTLLTLSMLTVVVVVLLIWTASSFDARSRSLEELIVFLTVRSLSIALLTGLIVFVAKLHSRHARQAVIYQEKLVGFDAVEMVVTSANTETIRAVVHQMARTYLRANADAFRGAERDADRSVGALLRLAKKLAKARELLSGPAKSKQ